MPPPSHLYVCFCRSKDACDDFVNEAFNEQGNINIYDIYADVCGDNVRRCGRCVRVYGVCLEVTLRSLDVRPRCPAEVLQVPTTPRVE